MSIVLFRAALAMQIWLKVILNFAQCSIDFNTWVNYQLSKYCLCCLWHFQFQWTLRISHEITDCVAVTSASHHQYLCRSVCIYHVCMYYFCANILPTPLKKSLTAYAAVFNTPNVVSFTNPVAVLRGLLFSQSNAGLPSWSK